MKLNVPKCKVMHFGRKTTGIEPSYYMYGEPIEEVCSIKDLGVSFSNDMKVSLHCRDSYSKANRMLGLISRTIRYRHPTVLINLYKSLVRPHLDYCSSVWNPYYIKDIQLLASLDCFQNFEACHMMIGFVSSVCGLFRKGATELILLSSSNWLKVSLVLHGMNSSRGLRTLSAEVTAGNC